MEPNANPGAPAPVAPAPQPTPAPAPEPTPAPQPAPQPTPTPTNPPAFTPGIANSPQVAQPTEPQPTPTDPANPPTPTPPADPNNPPAPAPEPAKQPTYDEYLESLTKDIKDVELPKPSDVDKDDPEGLTKFFAEQNKAAVEQAKIEMRKEMIIQNAEAKAWGEVFTKYPEIQTDQALRDTIHNIRVGAYASGKSLSPLQAADALVSTLHNQYKKGVNDAHVQTRVQDSQPLNGGGNPPAAPTVDYAQLQDGGRNAAVAQLQAAIEAGQI